MIDNQDWKMKKNLFKKGKKKKINASENFQINDFFFFVFRME